MAVDPNIKKKADDIRNKIYGKEVRESLASGLEAMSSDVVENEGRQSVVEGRQDSVESQWQAVSDEMTDKDVISAPEIIAARNGEANLKARLDKENQEVTTQLAQTANSLTERYVMEKKNVEDVFRELEIEKNKKHTLTLDRFKTVSTQQYLSLIFKVIPSTDVEISVNGISDGVNNVRVYRSQNENLTGQSHLEFIEKGSSGWQSTITASQIGTWEYLHLMIRISGRTFKEWGKKVIVDNVSIKQNNVELLDWKDFVFKASDYSDGITQYKTNIWYRTEGYDIFDFPGVVYVDPFGSDSESGFDENKPTTWENYVSNLNGVATRDKIRFVVLGEGTYYHHSSANFLALSSSTSFVCPNGKAVLQCGDFFPKAHQLLESGKTYSVDYSPENHYKESVRNGTEQPQIVVHFDDKYPIKYTNVGSVTQCKSTPNSYYYDFSNETMYVNFGEHEQCDIAVPERQNGIRVPNTLVKASFVNIECHNAELSNFNISVSDIGSGHLNFFNCGAIGSGIQSGEGFYVRNFDVYMDNCKATSIANDGFNFHTAGNSVIIDCTAIGCLDDGMSHHSDTTGYVYGFKAINCVSTGSVPAMGAWVYHENCYAENCGYRDGDAYYGAFGVTGTAGKKTTGIFINCKAIDSNQSFATNKASAGNGDTEMICINTESINPDTISYKADNGTILTVINTKGDKSKQGDVNVH